MPGASRLFTGQPMAVSQPKGRHQNPTGWRASSIRFHHLQGNDNSDHEYNDGENIPDRLDVTSI